MRSVRHFGHRVLAMRALGPGLDIMMSDRMVHGICTSCQPGECDGQVHVIILSSDELEDGKRDAFQGTCATKGVDEV